MTNAFRKSVLASGDLLMMQLALGAALWIRGVPEPLAFWREQAPAFAALHAVWIAVLYVDGFYQRDRLRLGLPFLQGTFRFAAFAGMLGALLFYVFDIFGIAPKTVLLLHVAAFLPLFILWRHLANRAFRLEGLRRPLAVLAVGDELDALAESLDLDPFGQFRVTARLTSEDRESLSALPTQGIDTLIVSQAAWRNLPAAAYDLALSGVRLVDSVTFTEEWERRLRPESPDLPALLSGFQGIRKPAYESAKRLADVAGATALSLALLPLAAAIALGVRLSGPGPVIYRQERVGRFGRSFRMLKFRSMADSAESDGPRWAAKDDPRATGFGRILRHTHLDEMPQLLNIIRGQMSFVGPRPERPEFIAELKSVLPHYGLRHLVRPGLTGWAQIGYRYGASVRDAAEKLAFDLWYVKHRSAAVDLKICLRTIALIFRGEGR